MSSLQVWYSCLSFIFQEVQHFLQAGRGGVTHCSDRKEGLKFLAGQLAAGKHEIPRLLQDCQSELSLVISVMYIYT